MTLNQKIDRIVRGALPNDATTYSVSLTKSGVKDTVIVRVVTSAWKSLPSFRRALKIQNALQKGLTPSEQSKILRVSVFGPEEILKQAILRTTRPKTPIPLSLAKKIAAKLKEKRETSGQIRDEHYLLVKALKKLRKS